jgi:LPXTG-motif cell wall-anchored protein
MNTPHVTTILTGVFVGAFAGFMDINEAVELTNIGTLFAFILVGIGVIVLRHTEPHRPRPFRCPWVPWVPLMGVFSCFYLMLQLPWLTWVRFVVWLFIGLTIYFLYSVDRSRLLKLEGAGQGVLPGQILFSRKLIGAILSGLAMLLLFSGIARHGALSNKIGAILAIPYTGDALHKSVVFAGTILLMTSLAFFYKSRRQKG